MNINAVIGAFGAVFCLCSSNARAQDADVAIVPNVPENTIMETFAESCQMMGRVRERESNAIICDTTRIGARSPSIIRMTYEPKGDGYSIKTMTQVNFGGILTWARNHENYPLDMVLARHVIEKQTKAS